MFHSNTQTNKHSTQPFVFFKYHNANIYFNRAGLHYGKLRLWIFSSLLQKKDISTSESLCSSHIKHIITEHWLITDNNRGEKKRKIQPLWCTSGFLSSGAGATIELQIFNLFPVWAACELLGSAIRRWKDDVVRLETRRGFQSRAAVVWIKQDEWNKKKKWAHLL